MLREEQLNTNFPLRKQGFYFNQGFSFSFWKQTKNKNSAKYVNTWKNPEKEYYNEFFIIVTYNSTNKHPSIQSYLL